ncbi:MAG: hypothetical protein ACK5NG_06645 [Chthoniobacterales bacterium]
MNLAGIRDYATGYPFKNLMWGARPWLTKNVDRSGPFNTQLADKIPLDKQGYPLEIPFKPEGAEQEQVVFTLLPNVTEPGRYILLYDGEGEIEGHFTTKVLESKPGRIVLEMKNIADDAGYEGFLIKKSLRKNPIRNIRILRLEDENADLQANPFREDFLDYARQWHVLRFMDWMQTNNSLEKEWAARKHPDFYTMVGEGGDAIGMWGKKPSRFTQLFSGGVALEILIQLANLTKTDPWFCIPHRATPEYMSEMAKLIKKQLDPSLTAYIEYSNEVWNWQFQQAHWMLHSKSTAAGLSPKIAWKNAVVPKNFPLDDGEVAPDTGAGHPERMGVLDRRCFEQFEKVFSGADRKRIVRVIGVQGGWFDTIQRTVDYVMKNGGADAISPAAYFGPNDEIYERWATAGAGLTADQVIEDMRGVIERSNLSELTELAKKYNLRLIAYEGGQHIQPKNQEETDYMPALKAAQYHPGMYDLYIKNLRNYQQAGFDLLTAFSSIGKQGLRWGSWGSSEYYGQPLSEAPKLRALVHSNASKSKAEK